MQVQTEVRTDQRLAGILDRVFPIAALSGFPHEGVAVAIGDQVMNGRGVIILLGQQQRLLGFRGSSTRVQEHSQHLEFVEADCASPRSFAGNLDLHVIQQCDGQPFRIDAIEDAVQQIVVAHGQ